MADKDFFSRFNKDKKQPVKKDLYAKTLKAAVPPTPDPLLKQFDASSQPEKQAIVDLYENHILKDASLAVNVMADSVKEYKAYKADQIEFSGTDNLHQYMNNVFKKFRNSDAFIASMYDKYINDSELFSPEKFLDDKSKKEFAAATEERRSYLHGDISLSEAKHLNNYMNYIAQEKPGVILEVYEQYKQTEIEVERKLSDTGRNSYEMGREDFQQEQDARKELLKQQMQEFVAEDKQVEESLKQAMKKVRGEEYRDMPRAGKDSPYVNTGADNQIEGEAAKIPPLNSAKASEYEKIRDVKKQMGLDNSSHYEAMPKTTEKKLSSELKDIGSVLKNAGLKDKGEVEKGSKSPDSSPSVSKGPEGPQR